MFKTNAFRISMHCPSKIGNGANSSLLSTQKQGFAIAYLQKVTSLIIR